VPTLTGTTLCEPPEKSEVGMPKLEHKKPVPVERRIFSANLRAARENAGLFIQQVVDITHITKSYISQVENGLLNISIVSMAQLSHAVQVPLYTLLNPSYKAESFNPEEWEIYAKLVREAEPEVLEQQLLAKNSREFRKVAGLTQGQVDLFADFREGTTGYIERANGNVTLDLIAPISNVLGVPFYKLFYPQ
jgi:transcriptional regulator with XRE-family HTH domain